MRPWKTALAVFPGVVVPKGKSTVVRSRSEKVAPSPCSCFAMGMRVICWDMALTFRVADLKSNGAGRMQDTWFNKTGRQ